MGKPQDTPLDPLVHSSLFEYDFAIDGGAVGTIAIPGIPIPPNCLIKSGSIWVKDAATSGTSTGTIAFEIVAASADILAATIVTSLTANALLDVVPDGTAANMIRTTDHVTAISGIIAVEALTAGKICVQLDWVEMGKAYV